MCCAQLPAACRHHYHHGQSASKSKQRALQLPAGLRFNALSQPHLGSVCRTPARQKLQHTFQNRGVHVRSTPEDTPPLTEEQDFDLLGQKVEQVSKELQTSLRGSSIFLVGMMGTGKSTVGKMLAYCLKYCFFDTDDIIEKYHKGTSVSEIFKTEGEEYFRMCESEVIKQLTPYRNCIVATGGGAVLKRANWANMQQGIVVWLEGSPEILARRVVAQGPEKRPLLYSDGTTPETVLQQTTEKLQKILDERREMYAAADITVSLHGTGQDVETGAPAPVVMYRIMTALDERIKDAEREREQRKNFTITNANTVPTMQVRESPAAVAEANQQ